MYGLQGMWKGKHVSKYTNTVRHNYIDKASLTTLRQIIKADITLPIRLFIYKLNKSGLLYHMIETPSIIGCKKYPTVIFQKCC